jgi:OFA family oxalate/formate antiporter-like MFS transporter
MRKHNNGGSRRWPIVVAGVFLQVALGAVYAWSVFRTPLARQFGWTIAEVTLPFTISIFVLGIAAFLGGLWMNRSGPRVVALTGGVLYGTGVLLASRSDLGLWWLDLTYGVIGGAGLGLSYIVPIAVLVKWFPDRKGLITGVAVGGFGAGALVTAPVAERLIERVGVLATFGWLGAAYLIVGIVCGSFMHDPPEPLAAASATPSTRAAGPDLTLHQAIRTWQWWGLWLLLFLNTSAGISIIAQEAPLFQELAGVGAIVAASMVGLVSIGNAAGRVLWAWVSDTIGRRGTFCLMFAIEAVLFWMLPTSSSAAQLTVAAFVILTCYGGGFGTMPAFAADYFGSRNIGSIYGLMLTAWGFAGAFGPLLIARMRESTGVYGGALHLIAVVMAVSALLPVALSRPGGPRPQPIPTPLLARQ